VPTWALGNPVRFILTGGQVHDILQAEDLVSGISFEHLLANKGYDANRLPRNLVERFFNKIKHFRRIAATRSLRYRS
jgi:transposase